MTPKRRSRLPLKGCLTCGTPFNPREVQFKYCSQKCSSDARILENPGYNALHMWLGNHFPKKNVCEHCNRAIKTDYAKLIGKEYERNRENFIELCKSCHRKYDATPEQTELLRVRSLERRVPILAEKEGIKTEYADVKTAAASIGISLQRIKNYLKRASANPVDGYVFTRISRNT